ncbi:MAG: 2-amino-4-hydroxy-6-hydroxymethyldihydropteridine diphosphokinase [Micrococcales bacterium]|nr:2-amino-4-hydroxy-6-hydroxymethyldihydropteridine diphosphokinase [Micrococcales bacterium]
MRTGTPLAGTQAAEAQPARPHDQAVDDGPDRIELRGLAAHGYHGVHEHERRDGQRFVVDIVVHTDTRPAAAADDLTRTLDYASLARQVVAVLTGPPVALLETLAERIAATGLAHPQAVAVDVTVHKPQAPLLGQPDAVSAAVEFADVVVSVRRDRTRVPVVDAPAPALEARPSDEFAVPDLAPSAADLAAEPSVTPYEAADLVEDPAAVAPEEGPEEGTDLPAGETDEPAAPEPADQPAWDEPMPPSIPPATVTPAPSSAGAVVVAPGLGPVVAHLVSSPDAAPAVQADAEPAAPAAPEPVVQADAELAALAAPEPEPVVPTDEPTPEPDARLADGPAYTSAPVTPEPDARLADGPAYTSAPVTPEPVVVPDVAPQVAPQVVEASWIAEAASDHVAPDPAAPDRAVPDPVWVPAPGPQEAPPQAWSAPAVPGWPSGPVPVASAPEPGPQPSQPVAALEPFAAGPVTPEPTPAWSEAAVPAAQPAVPATWPGPAEAVQAVHPAEALPSPWAVGPVAPPGEPAPPVGEPWGSAPALPEGWAPPPPPQWANLDPPGNAAQVAAPPAPAFAPSGPDPAFASGPAPAPDAPARTAGAQVLDQPPSALTNVVIGVGGNLGPVQETLRWAVLRLGAMTALEVTAVGPLARTAAVGSTDQPDYLNTVVLARTLLSPRDLLRRLQGIEREAGRERLERWGPRTLDLDIIAYGDLVVGDDELTLPHPRAHERAFVLGPWASLASDAVLPGPDGGPVARLADHAPDARGVRWMALDWLTDTPGEPGAA